MEMQVGDLCSGVETPPIFWGGRVSYMRTLLYSPLSLKQCFTVNQQNDILQLPSKAVQSLEYPSSSNISCCLYGGSLKMQTKIQRISILIIVMSFL